MAPEHREEPLKESRRFSDYKDHVFAFRRCTNLTVFSLEKVDHQLHLTLLVEELRELMLATTKEDQADALADCVVVLMGYHLDGGEHCRVNVADFLTDLETAAAERFIRLGAAFQIVHESNMTKVVRTDGEKHDTEQLYAAKGVTIEWRQPASGIFAAFAANTTEFAPAGKLLKPAGFKPPNWARKSEYLL